ncbi:MAG: homogentisate 1,2-dioxygenase [Bacteroidetes bacterium]|nr:homogentisate 1,2-dioxygenase [Bacteroidota bacterium]
MHYFTLGSIPHKRHTIFRQPDGKLYSEELFSTEGFSNDYSLMYHVHPPTKVLAVEEMHSIAPRIAIKGNMQHRSLATFKTPPHEDYIQSRVPLLVNKDVYMGVAAPLKNMDYFFKNADADELLFIHEGEGTLHTAFGDLPFAYGDYLIIPRGTIYKLSFKDANNRIMYLESFTPITPPRRYLSKFGQLMEHSPYCERDIRKPQNLQTNTETGEFKIIIKKQDTLFNYTYANHPFDVIGWDGNCYPYAFSIHDFEPITGRVHQPPPVHQTFEAHNFVVCSFCPRLFDYHPQSIPAPYNHSNIDSDEVLYYVDGDFMSRKHVVRGQITLHPKGIPHGPHPGTVEKSIGAKETKELAVMVDTFHPLMVTEQALEIEEKDYFKSWME